MFKQVRTLLGMFALFLTVFAVSAMAQTSTTGSIDGEVVDMNNAVVPGVTVTATSANLIRPQTATTNGEGQFRIPNLPPGKYSVIVEGTNFSKFERTDVEVNLSKTSTIAVQLQPTGVAASVEVTATGGATIDTTTNTSGTNVSTDQFSNFPTQRTVQSIYSIAPTATNSGLRDAAGRPRDPSVGGSSGPENNYILDGVTTSDPAYGGGGANLPFEFVQEVEVKTGSFGAEYGKATGGIFNVITKSGGNDFRGDLFGYLTTKGMVRGVKNFSQSTASNNGFSELDAGFDLGGPIVKDKLWFFGAFNPQRRKNFFLGQSLLTPFENKVTTPFYAGKITFAPNQNNTLTFSTFGDFTKIEGFQVNQNGSLGGSSNGFGLDQNSFLGTTETGGHNYIARLNSTISPTWIGEFSFGVHLQRYNSIPPGDFGNRPAFFDNFSILKGTTIAPVVETGINFGGGTGFLDYQYLPGGTLQRTLFRSGYAPIFQGTEKRNRYEGSAKLQNIFGKNTVKYGFEYVRNMYDQNRFSTGPTQTFGNPNNVPLGDGGSLTAKGFRIDQRWLICSPRGNQLVCPSAAATQRAAMLASVAGFSGGAITGPLTLAETVNNPFLIRNQTRIRDFRLVAKTHTATESFYVQDDYKAIRDVTFNFGVRWDYQQAYGKPGEGEPLKLNNFWHNLQPRLGVNYDFTGNGRGKIFANYARYVETPIPLDINVRALSDTAQTDIQLRVDRNGAPIGSNVVTGLTGNRADGSNGAVSSINLGASHTPPDPDLKPQTVNDLTAGIEYGLTSNMVITARGIYRAQGSVIEDGSFDDGDTYFLFNPGESLTDRLAQDVIGQRFGRARRYYRAFEVSATKRFSNNYQFISSYVYSSLIGNYEGLFRNDNGQSDPNITSLFDLVSLLTNTYGRLPNDRPHQLKFDGSYQTPFKLLLSASFRGQSGVPFNELIPHPVYGNDEGFGVPRGTAINPLTGKSRSPFTTGLDLGFYYPVQLGENRQLRFTADWFNIYNSQRAVLEDRSFTLGTGLAGVPNVPNPFYGQGVVFQQPSTLRLGVKFQF